MARIMAVANQKGGVGKTTTSVNLAASLAKLAKRVLLIDLDPQGNTTVSLGVDREELKHSSYELLLKDYAIESMIRPIEQAQLDLIGANADLTAAEVELLDIDAGAKRLYQALQAVNDNYDFIIIDCPPTLNMLTVNALAAADGVLVPVQCEYFALEGLSALMETVQTVKHELNARLQIDGLLRTMYDRRNNLANDVSNELVAHFGMQVLQTIVPRNIRLAEAPSYGESILDYDAASTGAAAYLALANEIIRKTRL